MIFKHAKLTNDTRILLNQARAKYLKENPEQKKYSDDKIINVVLLKYLEG